MRIDAATAQDVRHVALRMREDDFREFSALYPTDDPIKLAEMLVERYGSRPDIIVASDADGPVAVGAAIETRPNVITLFFMATPRLPKIGKALTRFIKKRLFPRLIEAGVHRFEAISMSGHDEAHRWIMALGLRPEGEPFENYGKNKEQFQQFAMVLNVR